MKNDSKFTEMLVALCVKKCVTKEDKAELYKLTKSNKEVKSVMADTFKLYIRQVGSLRKDTDRKSAEISSLITMKLELERKLKDT